MDLTTIVLTSMMLNAAATASNAVISAAARDAYDRFKTLWRSRVPDIDIEHYNVTSIEPGANLELEAAIARTISKQDTTLFKAAQDSIILLNDCSPKLLAATGVSIADVEAERLRITEIVAVGDGVVIERSKFSGPIEIKKIHAGMDVESRSAANRDVK